MEYLREWNEGFGKFSRWRERCGGMNNVFASFSPVGKSVWWMSMDRGRFFDIFSYFWCIFFGYCRNFGIGFEVKTCKSGD